MESNDQFSQELPSELSQIAASEPENSTNQELDELELDAIAGGFLFWGDPEQAGRYNHIWGD